MPSTGLRSASPSLLSLTPAQRGWGLPDVFQQTFCNGGIVACLPITCGSDRNEDGVFVARYPAQFANHLQHLWVTLQFANPIENLT